MNTTQTLSRTDRPTTGRTRLPQDEPRYRVQYRAQYRPQHRAPACRMLRLRRALALWVSGPDPTTPTGASTLVVDTIREDR